MWIREPGTELLSLFDFVSQFCLWRLLHTYGFDWLYVLSWKQNLSLWGSMRESETILMHNLLKRMVESEYLLQPIQMQKKLQISWGMDIYIPLSLHHSFVNSYYKIRAWLLVVCGWLSQFRAILLDPSCSGSGTITDRLDHLLPSHSAGSTDSSLCICVCSITNLFVLLLPDESVLKQFVLPSPLPFLCSKTICS